MSFSRPFGLIGAPVALAGMLAGCAPPTVDAVAVWIDDDVDEKGRRSIQIYDEGQRRSIELEPKIASSSTDLLRLRVAPGGRGFAASAVDTAYIDLRDGGRGHMDPVMPPIEAELSPFFSFTRSGESLRRQFADQDSTRVVNMATVGDREAQILEMPKSDVPGVVLRLCPELEEGQDAQSCLQLRSASAAPVLYAVELGFGGGPGIGSSPLQPGRVVAWGFPGVDARGGFAWAEPTLLAVGEMHTRSIDPEQFPARIDDIWCLDRVCVTPEGEAIIAMQPDPLPCTLLRWRWDGAHEPNTPPIVETLPLSPDCPRNEDPWLIAALAPDLVVLDDDDHIHLTDLTTGAWVSMPKLGVGPPLRYAVDEGRAMLFVADNGAVSRADDTGVRIVNAEHTACSRITDPVVSPSGNWVLQTCLDDTSAVPFDFTPVGEFGSIVRVSAAGLERFDGIPMIPLAVDDDGNGLLYSFDRDDDDRSPRGLFVLDAAGEVVRVDELEPTPRRLVNVGYISAEPTL